MVYFLTLPEGSGHVANFVKHFGRREARGMAETTYGEFLGRTAVPFGTYVFADRIRMNPHQKKIACRLWDAMAKQGKKVKLLNNPHVQLGRYELLSELVKQRTNDFRAWRLHQLPREIPFPVFVRRESDHGGPRSGLLYSLPELWGALAGLAVDGVEPNDMLVCQFQETIEPDGVYRKYGAFRVGEAIYGQFLILERRWEKVNGERIRTPEALEENLRYFQTNPHEDLLRPFFEMAGVDYGRVDYAFSNGRIQIWEINDNPFLAMPVLSHYIAETGPSRYLLALEDLQPEVPSEGSFALEIEWSRWIGDEVL